MSEPDDPRARLAAQLNDTVIGPLGAVAARLNAVMPRTKDADLQRDVGDAAAALDAVIADVRTVVLDLQRGDSDPDSVEGRVRALALAAGQRLGCTPRISLDGPLEDVDTELADDLVAVAGEALTNVVRHSYAGTIAVAVTIADGRLTLEVRDDGVGPNDEPTGGAGLPDMRARAERRGGEFALVPNEPMGTLLRWSVPTP